MNGDAWTGPVSGRAERDINNQQLLFRHSALRE